MLDVCRDQLKKLFDALPKNLAGKVRSALLLGASRQAVHEGTITKTHHHMHVLFFDKHTTTCMYFFWHTAHTAHTHAHTHTYTHAYMHTYTYAHARDPKCMHRCT